MLVMLPEFPCLSNVVSIVRNQHRQLCQCGTICHVGALAISCTVLWPSDLLFVRPVQRQSQGNTTRSHAEDHSIITLYLSNTSCW